MTQAVVEIVGGPRDGERLHVLKDAREVLVPIERRPDGRRVIDGLKIPKPRKRW